MKGQWGKFTGYFLGTLLVSAAITFLPPLIGGGSWLPPLISTEGKAIDELFWGLMVLCVVIFAIVGAIVVYSLVHFRAAPGDLSDGEHIHGNAKMEVAWIVIPSVIVAIVGVLSFIVLQDNEIGLYDQATAKEQKGAANMRVDVHAFSFGWGFRYKEADGSLLKGMEEPEANPELVLPVDEVVRFHVMSCTGKEHLGRLQDQVLRELSGGKDNEFAEIEPGLCEKEWDATTKEQQEAAEANAAIYYRADQKHNAGTPLTPEEQKAWDAHPTFHGDQQYIDVNHAFWVPEARMKIDAASGLKTYVQWTPDTVTGPDDRYQVVCAELCGSGHNGMRTDVCIVSGDTFDWWTALEPDARAGATCVNLRLFTCFRDVKDRDALLDDLAKLTNDDPEANCEKAEEAAA